MRSIFLITPLLLLLLCGQAHAHTLYFSLTDNGDNMIELEGMFSNGIMAAHITVALYAKEDGTLLWQGRTDEFGACIFERPNKPYEVELDGGPGHRARQDGI